MNTNLAYTPIYPHDPIEEIDADVFMARGSIQMNRLMRITRNMAIVRDGRELTVINPIRLDRAGEAQLKGLGDVRRVLRLGCFHGADDPYYVDTFNAEMWSQSGGNTYPEPPIDTEITAETTLPFANARLFLFEKTKQPECALIIERERPILLTCDGIQHYGDYRHNNLPARLLMPFIGFPKTTIVGPLWLKFMTPEGESLKSDFDRLLSLRFERLLSAHGSLLTSGAHAAVSRAVAKAFPEN